MLSCAPVLLLLWHAKFSTDKKNVYTRAMTFKHNINEMQSRLIALVTPLFDRFETSAVKKLCTGSASDSMLVGSSNSTCNCVVCELRWSWSRA